MRYDSTAMQYIFNLATKVLCADATAGYNLKITGPGIGSGPVITANTATFGLKS
jgi:hypothetical protein